MNGNVLTRSVPDSGPTTYSYDALDRLTREQGPAVTQSFGYDGAGNRQSDGIGSYVYAPSSNRLTNRPQGSVTLDAAGHTTAQAGFSYTWDGPGRIKTVSLSGTLLATYHYDHRSRRTRRRPPPPPRKTWPRSCTPTTGTTTCSPRPMPAARSGATCGGTTCRWRRSSTAPAGMRCGLPIQTGCFHSS